MSVVRKTKARVVATLRRLPRAPLFLARRGLGTLRAVKALTGALWRSYQRGRDFNAVLKRCSSPKHVESEIVRDVRETTAREAVKSALRIWAQADPEEHALGRYHLEVREVYLEYANVASLAGLQPIKLSQFYAEHKDARPLDDIKRHTAEVRRWAEERGALIDPRRQTGN